MLDDANNNKHHVLDSLSILIVDDNFDIVRLMERALKEHGFNLSAFTDPSRALEDFKINYKTCSLILSDIIMPKMNDYEFVKKAKEIDTQTKIVLMSALEINDKEFHNILSDIKVDAFLQKPISMGKLKEVIEKISAKDVIIA
jgi:two-component system catabolic regulation response regulator CreB/two-component system response regulator ChvI